ncbi:MAG: hypothetical protein WDA00_03435 [Eubacteriales bacterium]
MQIIEYLGGIVNHADTTATGGLPKKDEKAFRRKFAFRERAKRADAEKSPAN